MPLYLVRHGQTRWNLEQRFQSTTDVALNETGRAQAQAIARRITAAGVTFQRAWTSPLQRAVETARIVLAGSPLGLEIEPRLSEISLGDYEGRREADLRAELGEAFDRWRSVHFTAAAPRGETLLEAIARAAPAFTEIASAARRDCVLVVGHQGINMAMMAFLSGRSDLDSLAGFRQRNDRVEVWDTAAGKRLAQIDV